MALRGLDGKVAIVTGGGSGMGAATSARLAEEGVKVVVVDVREDAAKETAAALPGDAIAVGADVSTVDGVDRYVQARSTRSAGWTCSTTTRATAATSCRSGT